MNLQKRISELLGWQKRSDCRKVLVCIDKFKDTLTAPDAAQTIKDVLKDKYGDDVEVQQVPIADGGDGFMDCIEVAKS